MECRDVREMADSFLSEELLTETNHEILRHLDRCPECRYDLETRRRLRASIRAAFERAPELQARTGFAEELRARVRGEALGFPARRSFAGSWWALAAMLLLAVSAGAAFWMRARFGSDLAGLAAGDHRDCALQFRLAEKPIPLEDAARRFDPAYRVLETLPPANIETASGGARVLERHSCVFNGQRFAHVVLEYRGSVISLLVTSSGSTPISAAPPDHPWNDRRVGSLSVVSTSASGHAIFLVGAVDQADLGSLADAVAAPVAERLAGA